MDHSIIAERTNSIVCKIHNIPLIKFPKVGSYAEKWGCPVCVGRERERLREERQRFRRRKVASLGTPSNHSCGKPN